MPFLLSNLAYVSSDGAAVPVLAPEVLCTADRANEPVDGYAQNAAPARFDTPSPAEDAPASVAPSAGWRETHLYADCWIPKQSDAQRKITDSRGHGAFCRRLKYPWKLTKELLVSIDVVAIDLSQSLSDGNGLQQAHCPDETCCDEQPRPVVAKWQPPAHLPQRKCNKSSSQ